MASKLIACVSLIIFISSCGCKEDGFGDDVTFVVPFTCLNARDTFNVNDTLWMEANFSKHVAIENFDSPMLLEDFNFFSEFLISEISSTDRDFYTDVDFVVAKGELGVLDAAGVKSYPIHYEESDDAYAVGFGVVLKQRGLFFANVSTQNLLFEDYDHPALYKCEDDKRHNVKVGYMNNATTLSNFNDVFRTTNVQYMLDLFDYDRYSRTGGFSFVVL